MAAVAAVSTSFAQVSITGGLAFGFIKDTQDKTTGAAAHGLVNTDAYIDINATEDLGGGMKLSGTFEFNADGERKAKAYAGDKSLVISSPAATFALANTRSGGNQGAALVAPVNLWEGAFDVGNVITRVAIDAAAVNIPLTPAITASVKYVEASNDGSTEPGSVTMVYGGTYAANGLKATLQYNVTNFTDGLKTALGVTDPRTASTDLSVIYDAGVAKVGFGYDSARRGKANGTDEAATLLGVSVPFGKFSAGLNYGKRDTSSFAQAGVQYDLSNRTNVNASYGTYTTGKGAVGGGDLVQDTTKVSLNHSF